MISRKIYFLILSVLLIISPMLVMQFEFSKESSNSLILEIQQGSSGQGQYVVVPITIYQVEGTTVTPQDIQDLLNRLNQLHNCEVVVYVWNGQILTIPDPDGGGGTGPGPNGSVVFPSGNNTGEHNNLSNSVANHPMNPTNPGVQLVICNQIVNTSGHSTAGGYAYSGQNPVVLAQHCCTDKNWGGKAMAHEIGHYYGLDHNGNNESRPNNQALVRYDSNGDSVVNGSDQMGSDGNGDGYVTQADQNFNMYGGFPPGTDYTPIQHSAMFNAARAIPGAEIRNLPSSGRPPIPPNIPVQISGNHTAKPVNQTSGVQSNNHRNVDLQKFTMFRNVTINNPLVKVIIDLNGSIIKNPNFKYGFIISNDLPMPFDDTEYNVTYTDGGLSILKRDVGGPWEGFLPSDLTFQFEYLSAFLTGDFNNTTTLNATQLDEVVNNTEFNEALQNSTLIITLNGSDVHSLFGYDNYGEASFQHNITVYASQADDDDIVNDSIQVMNAYLGNCTNLPYILTTNDYVIPGNIIEISVYGFKPNSQINITLNGENILTPTTDATGNATISYEIPIKPTDHYVLAVVDENNQTDAMYLHIEYTEPSTQPPVIPGFEFFFVFISIGVIFVIILAAERRKFEINI